MLKDWIKLIVIVTVCAVVLGFMVRSCRACERAGGQYVKRFDGGYSCVEGREIHP